MIDDKTNIGGESEANGVAKVVERNIRDLIKVRSKVERKKTPSERVADWIVRAAGNMIFFTYMLLGSLFGVRTA